MRRSGTTADKVAALTLLVQESAVANLKALDSLLGWVQKRKGGKDVVRQVGLPPLALLEFCVLEKMRVSGQGPVG